MPDDGTIILRLILCGRQRADRLGEKPVLLNLERCFTCFCAEHGPADLKEVTNIKKAIKGGKSIGSHLIRPQEQLDLSGAVLDVGESDLAHRPNRPNPASKSRLDVPDR